MPILSSLGALTYTKTFLGDQYYWVIEVRHENASPNSVQLFSSAVNNNDVVLGGSVQSNGLNRSLILKFDDNNFSLPISEYGAFYANASVPSGEITDVKFDSNANIIIIGNERANSAVRILENDGNDIDSFVDTRGTGLNPTKNPSEIIVHANGSYTVAGVLREDVANLGTETRGFITNYTGNIKNYAKTFGVKTVIQTAVREKSNGNILVQGQSALLELSSDASTIINQIEFENANLLNFDIDQDENTYVLTSTSPPIARQVSKLDNSGNLIWQKEFTGNIQESAALQATSIRFYDNNVIVSGQAEAPGGNIQNGIPIGLISFDATSGNINWQNKFTNQNQVHIGGTLRKLTVESGNIYITAGTNFLRGYAIKIPADGTIPGNGSYENGKYIYEPANVQVMNGSVNIITGNVSLEDAQQTDVVNSELIANTNPPVNFITSRII